MKLLKLSNHKMHYFKLNLFKKQFSFNNSINNKHIWGKDKEKDINEFKNIANLFVDDIIKFNKSLETKRVVPDVKPLFLDDLKFDFDEPATTSEIKKEIDNKILPYMTLWSHPRFLNWYPSLTSYPAILGNLISNSVENPGKNYDLNKSGFDLENKIIKWAIEMYNLGDFFSDGYVNMAAGEISVIAALTAKSYKYNQYKDHDKSISLKFKYYYSSHAHYSVSKGVNITGASGTKIPVRWDDSKSNYTMDIKILKETIEKDVSNGYIPCYVCGTLGTTGTSGCDDISEINKLKEKYDFYLHVDAAYGGNFMMLEEYSYLKEYFRYADSCCINGNKGLLVGENSGFYFFKSREVIHRALETEHDLRNITNSELYSSRFNKSIRIFNVMQSVGLNKFKETLRRFIKCAKIYETKLSSKFKIICPAEFALICFTCGSIERTKQFMEFINKEDYLNLGPYDLPEGIEGKKYVLRISINYAYVTEDQTYQDCEYLLNAYDRCFLNNNI